MKRSENVSIPHRFNSHRNKKVSCMRNSSFNPSQVQFTPIKPDKGTKRSNSFNPSQVQFTRGVVVGYVEEGEGFNPSQVQFTRTSGWLTKYLVVVVSIPHRFNSHVEVRKISKTKTKSFQSLTGSIHTSWKTAKISIFCYRFNPSQVQFTLMWFHCPILEKWQFQSLTGSIHTKN